MNHNMNSKPTPHNNMIMRNNNSNTSNRMKSRIDESSTTNSNGYKKSNVRCNSTSQLENEFKSYS